jgi:hypothetical protein
VLMRDAFHNRVFEIGLKNPSEIEPGDDQPAGFGRLSALVTPAAISRHLFCETVRAITSAMSAAGSRFKSNNEPSRFANSTLRRAVSPSLSANEQYAARPAVRYQELPRHCDSYQLPGRAKQAILALRSFESVRHRRNVG